MSASPLSILPSHKGLNLADLKPLLRLGEGEKNQSSSLTDAIKERYDHYYNLEKATWKELISAGEEVAMFIQGKQFLMPNPFNPGGWIPYSVKPNSSTPTERRALSMMQYHTSGNLEKWLNSNPDVRVRPGVESDDAQEASEAAKIIVDHYENKFYGARVTIAECLEGLTFGSYIWRLRVDPALKSVTAYRQIFENKTIKLDPKLSWGKCGDCPHEGTAEDFTEVPGEGIYLCPKCHNEALVIPPATDEVPTLTGTEPVELGDFRLDLQSFAQCRWDLRYHADESSWFIIRRKTTMSAIRQILGNIKLPEGSQDDYGLDVVDRLAYSGQARAGHSNSSNRKTLYKDPATVEEFWMSPDEYGDIILQHDTETVGGHTIKGGVPLREQAGGQNICVLGLNGMSAALGIFIEDHKDYVVQGKWYAKPSTGAGRGLQDLTEVQKNFNSDHQQIHTYLRSTATPAMLVASEVLGEEGKSQYIGNPKENIPVSLAMLKEGVGIKDLVAPAFTPGSVPAQFFEFTYNRLTEHAQFASHFLPFTGGLPGVDNSTATGANITQAATNALYTPVLSIKGEIRKLIAEKLIKLYPKHFPIERYFPLGGKYERHAGKWLSGANLNTDLVYDVVPDSWNPKNSYTRRQDYAGFFQMIGGPQGYLTFKQAEPDRLADMERIFDLEVESETRNVASSLCFRRVQMMQQASKLIQDPQALVGVQQNQDPSTGATTLIAIGQGAIQPPVSQAEPAHSIKREWLMEWLDSNPGQEAQPHLRAAVELLIMLHTQYDGQQASMLAAQQGAVQVAGQVPQAIAGQAAQGMQAQQQMEQQRQQMQLQQEGQQANLETDIAKFGLDTASDDHEHDHVTRMNAAKADDREHALAVEQARGQQ